jgi:hypothetical protein
VPKSKEVTGDWRNLHNEELRDVYSSPSYIENEMGRACHTYVLGISAYRVLVGKPEG